MYAFTAAHKTLPLPSYARVTNPDNGRSVVVRVNDRGPFHPGRIIDLSYAAAVKLGYRDKGTARVEVKALAWRKTTPANRRHARPGRADARRGVAPVGDGPQPNVDTAMDKLVDALPIAGANAGERVAPASRRDPANRDLRFDGRMTAAP